MPKFYLECENWDGFKNTAEFEADFLEDIKENIDLFLKGAGFTSEGFFFATDQSAKFVRKSTSAIY